MNNLKKRRLGRGLEALLGATSESTVAADRPVGNLSDLLTDPPLPSSHVLSPNVASPSVSPAIVASGPVAAPVVGATLPSNHATFAGHPLDPIDPPSNLSDPGLVAPRDSSSLPAAAAARVAISASTPSVTSVAAAIESPEGAMLQLPVLDIQENPFQPRRVFSESEIASLSESLKEHDMLQPILVRVVSGKYQLISGERRLRAAIQAGWKTIPARVREADDRLVAELAIVENLQRKDLNAIEKALSFRRYLTEHQSTQEELASRLKIDRSTIANLMRILELPEVIQEHVSHNRISAGHARAILPLGKNTNRWSSAAGLSPRDGVSAKPNAGWLSLSIDRMARQSSPNARWVIPKSRCWRRKRNVPWEPLCKSKPMVAGLGVSSFTSRTMRSSNGFSSRSAKNAGRWPRSPDAFVTRQGLDRLD
jgi:ParB/RepB/Spo0J family partition protein